MPRRIVNLGPGHRRSIYIEYSRPESQVRVGTAVSATTRASLGSTRASRVGDDALAVADFMGHRIAAGAPQSAGEAPALPGNSAVVISIARGAADPPQHHPRNRGIGFEPIIF